METQVTTVNPSLLTPNRILNLQQMRDNIGELSQFVGVKAVVICRTNSTPTKNKLAEYGDWWDMELEKNLGKTLKCSVLCLKYLCKASDKKSKEHVDSMILLPDAQGWKTHEATLKFREKYGQDDKKYKYEEGCDLLVYIPEIQQYRHIFMKGALNGSVDAILTACANSANLAYVELTATKKGNDEKEWYLVSAKWIGDNQEPMNSLDKVLENFLKVVNKDKEDLEVHQEAEEPKKKAR
jgi:hypothetical protein